MNAHDSLYKFHYTYINTFTKKNIIAVHALNGYPMLRRHGTENRDSRGRGSQESESESDMVAAWLVGC